MLKVTGLLAALAMSVNGAPAAFPLDALLKDPAAARAFDYWSLRQGREPAAITALAATITADDDTKGCRTDAELAIAEGLAAAAKASSETEWRADRDAAAKAWTETVALQARLLAGQPIGQAFADDNVGGFLTQAKAAKTAPAAELFRRVAADQANLMVQTPGDLSAGASARLNLIRRNAYCRHGRDNAEWLKRRIADSGWFTLSRDGADADKAAWLMVQHADHDRPFQREVLALLGRLKDQGETSKRNYAYLQDRVSLNAGEPQRYGTQVMCVAGKRQPRPLEAPEGVEQRRAEMGLEPLADYFAKFGPCPAA